MMAGVFGDLLTRNPMSLPVGLCPGRDSSSAVTPSGRSRGRSWASPKLIVEAVHPELLPEVLPGDAQDLGRHRPLAVGLRERPLKVFALELLERGAERPGGAVVPLSTSPARRCRAAGGGRRCRPVGKHGGVLDGVPELANVAGKVNCESALQAAGETLGRSRPLRVNFFRKYCTRSGRSPRRSRSGGMSTSRTLSR